MAIAFDAVLNRATDTGTTHTVSFTVTGSDTAIVVFIETTGPNTINSVTYGGDALTSVDSVDWDGAGNTLDSYILVGTKTGANDIVVTFAASEENVVMALSYTGVESGGSTGGSDSHNTASWTTESTDQTIATTTVADNAWIPGYFRSTGGASFSAGTNVTIRENVASIALSFDTGAAITPAGSTNQTFTHSGGSTSGSILSVGLKPLVAVTFTPTVMIY